MTMNHSKSQAIKAALRRWQASADRPTLASTAESVAASVAWIIIAMVIAGIVTSMARGSPARIYWVIGFIAVVIRAGLLWHADTMGDQAGRAMVTSARADILSALAERGAGMLDGAPVGTRLSHIFDRTQKLSGYGKNWRSGVRQAFLIPLIVVIAVATQSWVCALLLVLSVGVMPLVLWLTISGTARAAKEQQGTIDQLAGVFQQRAGQVGLLKVFRAVGREENHIAQVADDLRIRTMTILRRAFLTTAALEFFASVSIALVAVYVGFKLLGVFPFATGETLTLREGIVALLLAPEFFAPLRRLSTLHHDRADGTAAAEEISSWLDETKDRRTHRLPRLDHAPTLTLSDVTIFRGDKCAVQHVTFVAKPGEVTVLAGPSGSGKTSCLLALLGLARHNAGTIDFDGRALADGESLAESAAYMRQTPWLAEGTLGDNLRLAKQDASAEELVKALIDAGLAELDAPDILSRAVGRGGSGLSGGQRQRLALARALLRDAPILLLDEPTAHLDEKTEQAFVDRLRTLRHGRTTLIASHRPAVIAAADKTIQFGKGVSEEKPR